MQRCCKETLCSKWSYEYRGGAEHPPHDGRGGVAFEQGLKPHHVDSRYCGAAEHDDVS